MKELKVKSGRPLLNYVILTADKYTAAELADIYGGIVPAGMTDQIKPYQTIISISPRLTTPLEVGQLVLINIARYGESVHKKNSIQSSVDENYDAQIRYRIPMIELDGKDCLKLGDNDIEFIIDEYEFVDLKKSVEAPSSNIILPNNNLVLN